jgi:hypothetical protein
MPNERLNLVWGFSLGTMIPRWGESKTGARRCERPESLGRTDYFGPFKETEKADSFVEFACEEYGKLGTASAMAISLIDAIPAGRGLLDPGSFKGFLKL